MGGYTGGGGLGSAFISGVVDDYVTLPTPISNHGGQFWLVLNNSGGFLSFLGVYKWPKGIYTPNDSLTAWEQAPLSVKVSEDTTTLVNLTNWTDFSNYVQDVFSQDRIVYDGVRYRNITGTYTSTPPNLDTTNWQIDGPGAFNDQGFLYIKGDETRGIAFVEDGTDNTFTAVTDQSISALPITSVTDNGGAARFNFTAETLYVGQTVDLSAFTETTYNVVGAVIMATDNTSYFEASNVFNQIAYVANDTGQLDADVSRLTDVGTTASDGDPIYVDTNNSVAYDGGYVVFNKQTNTFDISAEYFTDESGAWSDKGLNQKNPKILRFLSPGEEESKYLFKGYVNDNNVANGAITNDVFRTMEFGTLIQAASSERFKLVNPSTGEFVYTGEEETEVVLTASMTCESAGVALEFRFLWYVDKNTGTFVPTDDANEIVNEIAGTASNTSFTTVTMADPGWRFRLQITRTSGSSGITTRYATLTARG